MNTDMLTANNIILGTLDNRVTNLLFAQKHIIDNNITWTQPTTALEHIFYNKPLYSWIDLAYELYFSMYSDTFFKYMLEREYNWDFDPFTMERIDVLKKINKDWTEYIYEFNKKYSC